MDLRVIVRVQIDESRRDDESCSVELAPSFAERNAADLHDAVAANPDVRAKARQPHAVHHSAPSNDGVVRRHGSSLPLKIASSGENPTTLRRAKLINLHKNLVRSIIGAYCA